MFATVHEHRGHVRSMVGITRSVLFMAFLGGLTAMLWVAFSSSEHTLTLALGALFATGMGFVLMMRPTHEKAGSTPTGATGAVPIGSHGVEVGGPEKLPNPLDQDLDMPL